MRTTPGVTEDWILRVVRGVPSTVYDNERTFMQMNGNAIRKGVIQIGEGLLPDASLTAECFTGPRTARDGMVSSIRRSCSAQDHVLPEELGPTHSAAFFAPLRIWRTTETGGGWKLTPLTMNAWEGRL